MVNLDEIILKTAQRETLELDEREGGEIPDVDLKGKYLSRMTRRDKWDIYGLYLRSNDKIPAPEILFVKTNWVNLNGEEKIWND